MMKTILTLTLALVATFGFAQTILLVDNTAGAPTGANVYNDLQTAINATTPGDIIHVKPSNIDYGTVTITDANNSITIYGIGYNPDKEVFLTSFVSRIDVDASGIRLSGLVCNIIDIADNTTSTSVANVSIDNCDVDRILIANGSGETANNVIVRNCVIGGPSTGCCTGSIAMDGDAANVVFNNCIIQSSVVGSSPGMVEGVNGTLFSHCLFLAAGTGANPAAFETLTSTSVNNCIFFGVSPRVRFTNSNNTFANNLTVNGADTVFTIGTGSSEVDNVREDDLAGSVFQDTDVTFQQYWNPDWSVALDPASSAQLANAGNDGTDIGLTGGSIPYNETGTPLPYIQQFIVPSVIKQGNDLPVEVTAIGN